LSFADGHAEIHHWKGPVMSSHRTVIYQTAVGITQQVPCSLSDIDMGWLTSNTPQN
jgi:hypothetical protein